MKTLIVALALTIGATSSVFAMDGHGRGVHDAIKLAEAQATTSDNSVYGFTSNASANSSNVTDDIKYLSFIGQQNR